MTGPKPLVRWRVVYTDVDGITHHWRTFAYMGDATHDAKLLTHMRRVTSSEVIDLTSKTSFATYGKDHPLG